MTGSGTLLDPYIIWDATDLQNMNLDLTAYYELGQDIDASATVGWNGGLGFEPVGGWGGAAAFTGTFDGKGYRITGLTVNRAADDYIGLFGETDGAIIKNIGMTNVNITGRRDVAALVGYSRYNTIISDCYSTGAITALADAYDVAGLVGDNRDSTISGCNSTCSITVSGGGLYDIGGLSGDNRGTITNSYSTGSVSVTGVDIYDIGGLSGDNSGTITNSYSTGSVSGTAGADIYDIGGLSGDNSGTITNSYFAGSVSVTGVDISDVGGLSGDNRGTITNSYSTGSVSGTAGADIYDIGGLAGDNRGIITNSYSTGSVSGTAGADIYDIGGLSGENSGTITNSYFAGSVSVTGVDIYDIGGFLGNNTADVTNSFWDIETSGQATSDGGTGLTSAEMVYGKAFAVAGWVQTIWRLNDGYYPCLIGVSPSCAYSPIPYPPWPPLPPTPPPPIIVTAIVGTLPATNIAENHATLNGVLTNSLAKYGEVRFQYGTTSAYGMNTPWQDGFFTGDDFYANITDVGEGSAYHFRAQFRGSPIVSGSDMTFSTLSSLGPVTMVSEELMQLLEG